jgi:hypothetical protein
VSASDSWKLLVFRDGKTVRHSSELLEALRRQIEHFLSLPDFTSLSVQEELIDALLRAGELECGLSDAAFPVETLAELTDRLALALISRQRPHLPSSVLDAHSSCALPEQIAISPPEGFCYYALHPLDYADLLNASEVNACAAAVVGIRSIGTTLSAVVSAWLNLRGIQAERITVRPSGHPFERSVTFEDKQREWIVQCIQRGAHFFVVDEGPGLSGSSFLAVAEALEQAGVPSGLITLLPSSIPNLDNLLAPNAAARWNQFRTLALSPTRRIPDEAAHDISGGEWRKRAFTSESRWPAVWPWTERRKYLSEDGKRLFRFDGHGHYGKTARQRSELLADHGWGPEVKSAGNGFSEFPWLTGTRPGTADRATVIQLARYCAFRAKHFSQPTTSQEPLEEMARINLDRALGVSIPISLPIERPVIADARMMPYEWIRCADGRMMKLDASSHGEDHFYPGPTDIAWDIAGAITEWALTEEAAKLLVAEYEQCSDDRIGARLHNYLIAYAVFRLALTRSGALSMNDATEKTRFQSIAEYYRSRLQESLCCPNFLDRVGGGSALAVLPHHRTCGSASGGS